MVTLAAINWQPILEGGDGPPLLFFLASGIVIIAVVAIVQWGRVRIAEAEASLKMRMVEQGYSPEQISQVLHTKVDRAERGRCRKNTFLAAAPT